MALDNNHDSPVFSFPISFPFRPTPSLLCCRRQTPIQNGETLVDLLGVAGKRSGLPMVICCSSRDELDSVCFAVSNLSFISLASLYSDLSEAECSAILDKFRLATVRWNQMASFHSVEGTDAGEEGEDEKSQMTVVTDACLPLLAFGEPPLSARVLINYELPTKKETYFRRMSTCLASDGIVISMVVGGGERNWNFSSVKKLIKSLVTPCKNEKKINERKRCT